MIFDKRYTNGLTLIEMLVVVAIVAILTTMVIGIAGRISNQSNEQLTKNTFALLNSALSQFRDYGYNYSVDSAWTDPKKEFYRSLHFPLDCNNFGVQQIEGILIDTLKTPIAINANPEPDYVGIEVLYFLLSRVPECRKTLDKIDNSLKTDEDTNGQNRQIRIGGQNYYQPLLRIIDPWGKPLRYDYYDEKENNFNKRKEGKRNFPLITSAGPDEILGTGDDIDNRM